MILAQKEELFKLREKYRNFEYSYERNDNLQINCYKFHEQGVKKRRPDGPNPGES